MNNFKTTVIDSDPRRDSPDLIKDPALLEPNMRRKVEAVIADAAAAGHRLAILETYRSPVRQERLYEDGKTQLEHVGVHGYGLACDLGILAVDGSVNWRADYGVLGRIARSHGLVWGGDWGRPDQPHRFRDYDHVQWCAVADQPKLFDGTWYPGEDYDAFGGG